MLTGQIGELILLDGTMSQDNNAPSNSRNRNSIDSETYQDESGIDLTSPMPKSRSRMPGNDQDTQPSTRTNTPYQSALASASGSTVSLTQPPGGPDDSFQSQDRQPGGEDLTPYVVQKAHIPASASTVVLRHADESSDDGSEADMRNLSFGLDPSRSPEASPTRLRRSTDIGRSRGKQGGTADKAGVILGIFNVFVVMPQFIITGLSSIIFHIMEPPTDATPKHPNAIPIAGNLTASAGEMVDEVARLVVREGAPVEGGSPDAVGLIFR